MSEHFHLPQSFLLANQWPCQWTRFCLSGLLRVTLQGRPPPLPPGWVDGQRFPESGISRDPGEVKGSLRGKGFTETQNRKLQSPPVPRTERGKQMGGGMQHRASGGEGRDPWTPMSVSLTSGLPTASPRPMTASSLELLGELMTGVEGPRVT